MPPIPIRLWIHHLAVAVRALRTDRFGSLIGIGGLAIGACTCLLVAFYARYELSYDDFWPDADRVVRLHSVITRPGSAPDPSVATPGIALPLLQQQLPQIEAGARLMPRTLRVTYRSANGERRENPQGWFVDPQFLQILPVQFIAGRAETALLDRRSLVLAEKTAIAWFGTTDVLGREVEVELPNSGSTWIATVSGVIREPPPNSHLGVQQYLMRLDSETFAWDRGVEHSWTALWGRTYLKLKPGVDPLEIQRALPGFVERNVPPTAQLGELPVRQVLGFSVARLTDLHVAAALPDGLMRPAGSRDQLLIMVALAAGILLIAVVNFANLSIAQASLRVREVALRKVLGAGRGELIAQFLLQSLVAAAVAIVAALVLTELLLPPFREFLDRPVPAPLAAKLLLALGLLVLLAFAGGAAPAWKMSALAPAASLRANRSSAVEGSVSLRALLVLVQFALAIGMIVALLVSQQQFRHLQTMDRGLDARDTISAWGLRWPEVRQNADAFMRELRGIPQVQAVTMSEDTPGRGAFMSDVTVRLDGDANAQTVVVQSESVDPNFFDTYRIRMAAGRNLGTENAFDEAHGIARSAELARRGLNVVVDQNTVRQLGLPGAQAAVGKTLLASLGPRSGPPVAATIVGVVQNARYQSLAQADLPRLFYFDRQYMFHFHVRFQPGTRAATTPRVEAAWLKHFPRVKFDPDVVEDRIAAAERKHTRQGDLFAIAAAVALLLSAAGMYSLAAFTTRRQAKEIALRRLMGARFDQVTRLLVWRLTRPVLIAGVIACPLAWYALSNWLSQYPDRTALGFAPLAAAIGIALGVAGAVAAGRITSVARRHLATELRYE